MSDAAARLRAQKAYSTDPEYLERMAGEEENRDVRASGKELKRTLAFKIMPGSAKPKIAPRRVQR